MLFCKALCISVQCVTREGSQHQGAMTFIAEIEKPQDFLKALNVLAGI